MTDTHPITPAAAAEILDTVAANAEESLRLILETGSPADVSAAIDAGDLDVLTAFRAGATALRGQPELVMTNPLLPPVTTAEDVSVGLPIVLLVAVLISLTPVLFGHRPASAYAIVVIVSYLILDGWRALYVRLARSR